MSYMNNAEKGYLRSIVEKLYIKNKGLLCSLLFVSMGTLIGVFTTTFISLMKAQLPIYFEIAYVVLLSLGLTSNVSKRIKQSIDAGKNVSYK